MKIAALPRARQHGITMVEFMVSTSIGLATVLVVTLLFASISRSGNTNDAVARLNSDARAALDYLERAARMAGYYGCLQPGARPRSVVNSKAYAYDFESGLRGYRGTGAAYVPAPPVDFPVPATADRSSDAITIRGGDVGWPVIAPFQSLPTDPVAVSGSVDTGQLVAIADCTSATIFQVTSATPVGIGTRLEHGFAGTPGNTSDDLLRVFFDHAEVIPVTTTTYFVAPGADGRNALFRIAGGGAPEEVVGGVAELRILYGIDADGDGAADRVVTAQSVADWGAVVSAQFNILMESSSQAAATDPVPYTFMGATITPSDRRMRRSYTSTVNIRNRSA